MNQIHNYIKFTSLASALVFLSATARATVTLIDTTNISLAATQDRGDVTIFNENDITGGLVTDLINYTPSSSNGWLSEAYSGDQLFNGNAGPGGANPDPRYAIAGTLGPDSGTGTMTLALTGGSQTVGSIAIYGGYSNRDDGTYTLRDDSGVLGAWNISTASASAGGVTENFWLVFDSPVTTANLFIDYVGTDLDNSVSFAAIQPFTSVPEPATTATLFGLVVGTAAMLMRRRA